MVRGASEESVQTAIDEDDPFPGTFGFAGDLPDGRLVRDVLGRELCYVAPDGEWAFDPAAIEEPTILPPGSVLENGTVRQAWELPTRSPSDKEEALDSLRAAFDMAVSAVPEGETGTPPAIGFSGGVDSTLLAARFDGPVYTVGFPESHDLEAARAAADDLGRPHHVVELDHDTLESLIPEVARAIDRTNAMDVQIALPLFAVARAIEADGHDRLVLGQGADELFGGYAKVAKAPDDPRVEADTIRGARDEVLAGLPAQNERDMLAVRAAGVEPVTPYLHDAVIEAALALPDSLIVADDVRKVALRDVAADYLPEAVANRSKKAMQYGTFVAREMDRLARQAGFKRRMDDHVTQYVESLL